MPGPGVAEPAEKGQALVGWKGQTRGRPGRSESFHPGLWGRRGRWGRSGLGAEVAQELAVCAACGIFSKMGP